MVSRLPLYPAWRQSREYAPVVFQHFVRLSCQRSVAWSQLDICDMGSASRGIYRVFSADRRMARARGATSSSYPCPPSSAIHSNSRYFCSRYGRLGIFSRPRSRRSIIHNETRVFRSVQPDEFMGLPSLSSFHGSNARRKQNNTAYPRRIHRAHARYLLVPETTVAAASACGQAHRAPLVVLLHIHCLAAFVRSVHQTELYLFSVL